MAEIQKKKADPDKATRTLERYQKGLKKMGINYKQLRTIGTGTRGVAFSTKGKNNFVKKLFGSGTAFEAEDRVLKITDDESEAAASNVLAKLGKKSDHIVHIYRVFKFGQSGYYGIILEKLNDLSAEEAKKFNEAVQSSVLPLALAEAPFGMWEDVQEQSADIILEKFKDEFTPEQIEYVINKSYVAYELLANEFNVDKMVNELSTLGINYHDYHAGNIMKRNDGTYVVLDLGYSKLASSNQDDIDAITEAVMRRLLCL